MLLAMNTVMIYDQLKQISSKYYKESLSWDYGRETKFSSLMILDWPFWLLWITALFVLFIPTASWATMNENWNMIHGLYDQLMESFLDTVVIFST